MNFRVRSAAAVGRWTSSPPSTFYILMVLARFVCFRADRVIHSIAFRHPRGVGFAGLKSGHAVLIGIAPMSICAWQFTQVRRAGKVIMGPGLRRCHGPMAIPSCRTGPASAVGPALQLSGTALPSNLRIFTLRILLRHHYKDRFMSRFPKGLSRGTLIGGSC